MKETPPDMFLPQIPDKWLEDEQILDELFSRPESKLLLERLTNQTLKEFRAGRTWNTDPGPA